MSLTIKDGVPTLPEGAPLAFGFLVRVEKMLGIGDTAFIEECSCFRTVGAGGEGIHHHLITGRELSS